MTNTERAKRIELLHPAYPDCQDADGVLVDRSGFVASALSDLRHYCDAHGISFLVCDRLARQHYASERKE